MSLLFEQAKVTSPIAHMDTSSSLYGMVLGAAIGVGVTVVTGGSGVVIFITAAATGASRGKFVAEIFDPAELTTDGHITDGSPDTFIGSDRQKAARASQAAPQTTVDCHGGGYVVQGSDSVFINDCGASRVLDMTSCGGIIQDGDATVFVAGLSTTIFEVGTVSGDANAAFLAQLNWIVGLAGLLSVPTSAFGGFMYVLRAAGTVESGILGPENGAGPIGELNGWLGPAVGVLQVATGSKPVSFGTAQSIYTLLDKTSPDDDSGDEGAPQP